MLWMYVGFLALVLLLLALDLGVFHRTAHVVSVREVLGWSAFWIGLGLAFTVFIYVGYERHWLGLGLTPDLMTVAPRTVEGVGLVYNDGASAAIKYLTGYMVEKSLAVDNIFVIAMLFGFFAAPRCASIACCFGGSWAPSSAAVEVDRVVGAGPAGTLLATPLLPGPRHGRVHRRHLRG